MDGSCKPLLFREVFDSYEAFLQGRQVDLAPPMPYRAFVEWLREQPLEEAEKFWRGELAGFSEPTALRDDRPSGGALAEEYAEQHAELDLEASEALRQFGRRHRLTLNTIVTGIWALLLSRSSGSRTVVFGGTVNARPAALDGAESILGLFINTLPVRVEVDPAAPMIKWLQSLQTRQACSRDYDFAPLSKVQKWSAVPRGQALFESIVVFENNAGYGLTTERYGDIEINKVRPLIRNSLPLTLRCVPGRELSIQLLYDTNRFSADTVREIAADVVCLLRDVPRQTDAVLARLLEKVDELERTRRAMQAQTFDATALDKLRKIKQQGRRTRTHQ
jgi:non-ribosomal peptide synthetase component F